MEFFSEGLKNEFKTARVHELSVFEPLKVYCMFTQISMQNKMKVKNIYQKPLKLEMDPSK